MVAEHGTVSVWFGSASQVTLPELPTWMNLYSTTSPGARLTVAAQRGLLDVYDEAPRATAELVSQLPSAETSPELVRGMVSTPSFLDRMVSRVPQRTPGKRKGARRGRGTYILTVVPYEVVTSSSKVTTTEVAVQLPAVVVVVVLAEVVVVVLAVVDVTGAVVVVVDDPPPVTI